MKRDREVMKSRFYGILVLSFVNIVLFTPFVLAMLLVGVVKQYIRSIDFHFAIMLVLAISAAVLHFVMVMQAHDDITVRKEVLSESDILVRTFLDEFSLCLNFGEVVVVIAYLYAAYEASIIAHVILTLLGCTMAAGMVYVRATMKSIPRYCREFLPQ